jgi:hypothetical protein
MCWLPQRIGVVTTEIHHAHCVGLKRIAKALVFHFTPLSTLA